MLQFVNNLLFCKVERITKKDEYEKIFKEDQKKTAAKFVLDHFFLSSDNSLKYKSVLVKNYCQKAKVNNTDVLHKTPT